MTRAYEDALKRIESQLPHRRMLAKRALSWITLAQRPLTTVELPQALAVESETSELDYDNIPDIEELISVCAGLVTVDEQSNVIRLVHYTAQEYFERVQGDWSPGAQEDIASTCLTYLLFDTFSGSGDDSDGSDLDLKYAHWLRQNPLLEYAARYWGFHAFTVQRSVQKLALQFLRSDVDFSALYNPGSVNSGWLRNVTGMHIAALFGLAYLLEELINGDETHDPMQPDAQNSDKETPLLWAASVGHEAVVKLLIGQDDVEADSRNYHGSTPLSLAASKGHEAIVKLLIERDDVEADSRNYVGCTPLSLAAREGHEAVVKLLMERHDVEVDSRIDYDRTPLSYAASRGQETIVKLLIARDDVEANSRDNVGRTPLALASRYGRKRVVNLLVQREDIDINARDHLGRTALTLACENEYNAIIEVLQRHGATL
ncbi:MAG: hypothetical protein M1822_009768 [Bathelium mastoideum]|nr:MAG: hypothetical protein M1822_009768 [Bathelium mastoideum]